MRRALCHLAVMSLAVPLAAQAPPDTLAYATTALTLRERPSYKATAKKEVKAGSKVRVYNCDEYWCTAVAQRTSGFAPREQLRFRGQRAPRATSSQSASPSVRRTGRRRLRRPSQGRRLA